MRIAFTVNNIQTERAEYTTILLAKKLHNSGHEVFFIEVNDLLYTSDGHMGAFATQAAGNSFKATETYLAALQSQKNKEKILATDLDILMLLSVS